MLQVALAQVRLNARRFIAVSLAVMIAVGFLTATLVINSSSKASLEQSVGEGFRNADLILASEVPSYLPEGVILTEDAVEAVRSVPGVDAVYPVQSAYVNFAGGTKTVFAQLLNTPSSAELLPVDVVLGTLPSSDSQVAVDQDTATRYNLSIGSTVPVSSSTGDPSDTRAADLTVSAVVSTSNNPSMMGTPQLYSSEATASLFAEAEQGFSTIQLALADDAGAAGVRTQLEQNLTDAGLDGIAVRTSAEQTEEAVAQFTGGEDALTIVLLAFAAVALLVCALVVSNTFSVLVAQRTRELALLRCIGASRKQIRRSVITEAALVGIVSSILGVAAAVGLVAVIVTFLKTDTASSFATLAVSPLAVVTGLGVGILLTLLSALVPARAATAVAPLAALRPAEDVRAGTRSGRIRLVIGLVLLAAGAALLGYGASVNDLMLAVPGGMLSFVGILMCATLFVPPLVRAVGTLAAPLGVPGKLAAVNAVRNPQRTAATSSALLIGVTLVAMMMTGAATARTSLDSVLAAEFPVDVSVRGGALGDSPLTAADAEAARGVDGVAEAVLLPVVGTTQMYGQPEGVYALEPADAAAVLQDQTLKLTPGTILMPQSTTAKTVTVQGAESAVELDVVVAGSSQLRPLISADTAQALGGVPETGDAYLQPQVWISVAEGLSNGELKDLQTELAETMGVDDYMVSGAVMERAAFEQVIDVLLMVVTGLLAVAVVIALVGVANTLSLSVLERTRESSLLRALGLTRGQLRGMLALEALLIAGVAALFGCVLGAVYGWLGARSALGSFADVALAVPWLQLLAVLAVAILAGLLASVLPARRAARLSPVAGLAAD
ncbi:ABC transporter permease [Arthrobacter sp. zg-Y820]|uniref:ABC transporter permease n=1 Tax=unclassified Arthrobacter TaxID=235627 RepID=UPI001E33C90B|nr:MULTISPECIES: FtsX family ABC transporter permease [unclassified Arthrobacter]MCC9196171.1 ABC transporter permease [Arthrobacter sp. zg-Y820]MDK1279031.1 ABC transporter permease [Arthrobacter sp. zg.Y820]WIB08559.1 ABC transporter permease [Arthrobacter sp. zg-Y820]